MGSTAAGLVKMLFILTSVAVISLSFLLVYHYLLRSSHFKLQEVKVVGVDEKIRHEVITMCNLSSDLSLLALNLNRLKEKMETHPWVRTVKLERRFPHTLVIHAEKQRPYALLVMKALFYVNRRGEIFKQVNPSDDMDYPVITGSFTKGSKSRDKLIRAIRVLKALEKEKGLWSLSELSEIHVSPVRGISLYFSHLAAEIKLSGQKLDRQVAGLKKVAKHLSQTGRIHRVKGIDLSYPREAVVSFRKG
jgi:cell division septal protein FtsQ